MAKRLTKRKLQDFRDMVDLAARMTIDATRPDASAEVVVMTAAMHATLALDIVPLLLDEIERLGQGSEWTVGVTVKMDRTGGVA